MYVPVRRGHGPLHISERTGRGYTTVCGHTLSGAQLDVPQPPRPARTEAQLVRFWERCWELERTCRKCDRILPSL